MNLIAMRSKKVSFGKIKLIGEKPIEYAEVKYEVFYKRHRKYGGRWQKTPQYILRFRQVEGRKENNGWAWILSEYLSLNGKIYPNKHAALTKINRTVKQIGCTEYKLMQFIIEER